MTHPTTAMEAWQAAAFAYGGLSIDGEGADAAAAVLEAWASERERELREALAERDNYLAQMGGCGDGHCIIVKPVGMHTNGGCRCATHAFTMGKFAFANNRFADRARTLLAEERGE
ncbi:hypothetical protein ACFOON_15080 [Novosphingobium piscinae]|uniref:Uncharacterized protein n=1 Tax=Novosphingobium piscinae TaxID=1507448 RepID=A0A7X1FXL4_9SPHN|nr:hypothetical protein [Novosphingobium piscinae]MBC2668776.1 hypothetical protein [Novosphingobium piscinae]